MSDDFTKVRVFGIDESELSTGSVNDNEVGTINAKKIKAHTITSDQIAAGSIGAVQLQAGAITAFKVTVPNRVKGTTVVFSVSDTTKDTLQWTSGIVYLQKMKYMPDDTMGDLQVVTVQQTISSGSYKFTSGDNAYYFYIEWVQESDSDEPSDSATLTMKKSTTYPSSDTAVVLAYAWYDSVLGLAQFQALDTAGGGVRISGNSIFAGSITAQNIKAGTITADRLSFPAFNKSTDTLDSITDGVTYKKVSSSQISTFTDGSLRAVTYIGSDGRYQTAFQSSVTGRPPQTGLYITSEHIGFYRQDLDAWTVNIASNGAMMLGSPSNNNYLLWDGTLTVKGNIVATNVLANVSMSSPYITLSGSGYIAGGKSYYGDTTSGFWLGYYYGYYTFVIGNASQYIQWDGTTLTVVGNITANAIAANVSINSPTINGGTFIQSSSSSQLNGLVAYRDQSYTAWYSYGQEVGRITYEYDTDFGGSSFKFSGSGTVGVKSTGGRLNLYGYSGVNIYSSTNITQSLIVSGDFAVLGNVNSSIKFGSGYGIQFYSPSGLGGNFWYSGGKLYFKDEGGTQHQISYT
jgi:hypothetical protein